MDNTETDPRNGTNGEARPHRGTNQAAMRARNERLVLTLIRRQGALAKARIADITGLSAQTVSVIVRKLEADDLLLRGEPQRGRVGQPSVPLSLNPDGAFFIGAKIGRRSLDVVLVDFTGNVRRSSSRTYPYPEPKPVIAAIIEEADACKAELSARDRDRIAGIGLAMPFRLWHWADEIGAPAKAMDAWRRFDVLSELETKLPYPAYVRNDATAACGAELAFGDSAAGRDFIYFFVGTIVGGGVVLNGSLYSGHTGNAAALGGLRVPGPNGEGVRLMDLASLMTLERRMEDAGLSAQLIQDTDADWNAFGPILDDWIADTSRGLAHGVAAASEIIDFESAVIDGAVPEAIRQRILDRVKLELSKMDLSTIDPPEVRGGSLGAQARAIGGASLPLFDRFLIDQNSEAGVRFSMTEAAANESN